MDTHRTTTYLLPRWQTLLVLLATVHTAFSDSCYWRNHDSTTVETGGWFACNNTETTAGGAQLCCLNGGTCGQDSICHTYGSDGGSGWYVGGCTDPTYEDPVCRKSCTGDYQTYIQYNYTEQLWHCCGSSGCTGTPTSETFDAIPPASWTAVPTTAIPFEDAQESGNTSTFVTVTATATPSAKASSGNSLSTGAIAAIAVLAALLGLALIAALAFFILWRKKAANERNVKNDYAPEQQQQVQQGGVYFGQGAQGYPPEMPQAELEGERHTSELDGFGRKLGMQSSEVRS